MMEYPMMLTGVSVNIGATEKSSTKWRFLEFGHVHAQNAMRQKLSTVTRIATCSDSRQDIIRQK